MDVMDVDCVKRKMCSSTFNTANHKIFSVKVVGELTAKYSIDFARNVGVKYSDCEASFFDAYSTSHCA